MKVERISNKAKELLNLEQEIETRQLSEEEKFRWRELISELFQDRSPPVKTKRKNFRIPVNIVGRITVKDSFYDCSIINISHQGLMLQFLSAYQFKPDDLISFVSAVVEGNEVNFNLQYRIVSLTDSERKIGCVILSDGNSNEDREKFFKKVYYPLYICYLKDLTNE